MFPKPDDRQRKAEAALRMADAKMDFRHLCYKLDDGNCRGLCLSVRGHSLYGTVHHIIHGRREPIHEAWNGIYLCNKCHNVVHGLSFMRIDERELTGDMALLAILDYWREIPHVWRWDKAYEWVKNRAERQAQKQIRRKL